MGKVLEDEALSSLKRTRVVSDAGVTYAEFRRTLKPRYGRVWAQIGAGYAALLTIAAGIAAIESRVQAVWIPLIACAGAIAIGYFVHFLHLYMHEGAHYNLAPNRKWNDRLANVVIGTIVGMHMRPYRPTHFDHHRYLGTPRDTEIAYFDPLNVRFALESMTGLRVLKSLINRNMTHRVKGVEDNAYDGTYAYRAILISATLHLAVVLAAAWNGYYALALAWAVGTFMLYPFLGSLRTLLEHRSEHASKAIDYHKTNHGETNRMFGAGPLARTYGTAGFNRHLLHHWDPQVSCTRLADLERFLTETEEGRSVLEAHRTTYARTFYRLYNR